MQENEQTFYAHGEKKKKFKGIGITWTLFVFLAIFTAFVLAVVWIFEVLLLDKFYENSKMKEIRLMSQVIEQNIESDTLETTTYTLAGDYGICALVYKINGQKAEVLISCDLSSRCIIHHMTSPGITRLYNTALASGGEYVKKVSLNAFAPKASETDSESTIYTKTFRDSNGGDYFLLLNSEMAPVSATVKTYMLQFRFISVILLVGALFIAVLMSRYISTPIVKLNNAVKRLAKGDYDAEFDGKGYREIHELSDALDYASEELSKNDRLQKELLANVSHDLRTPLTMVRGYSEMMRDIPGENTPENAQIVIDETTRLSELVNDMLDISKIQSGARKMRKTVFDITETVRGTLSRYEKLTEKDGYKITFEASENVHVCADRTMMLQVVYNLINNAVNYTGEGKTVDVVQTVNGKNVRISVTDTGEGISKENLPYIWDRYYKVDKVHRRAMVGTGLGLSIVKNILEAHDATYGVESTEGKGSTFWFELPVFEGGAEDLPDTEADK